MLQAMRDKTRGWIAYVIVGVLVVPFATFGLYNYLAGGGNPVVAEVNGMEIKRNELDAAIQRQQRQLRERMGQDYDPDAFDDATLTRQALDQLITRRVLRSFVDEHGLVTTDTAVAERIRSQDAFQKDGEFSSQRYREVLKSKNIPVAEYENRVRRGAAMQTLSSALGVTAIVTDAELARVAAVQYQKRHVSWLRVAADSVRDQVNLGDEAVEAYYEENQDAFRQPQQVRLAYLSLSPSKLAGEISVSEEDVRERYEQVRDQRGTPERRRTRHILLKVPEDSPESEVEAARERLEKVRARIRNGEITFEEAAREVSEDSVSGKQGGKLGVVSPGEMVEPFENAVFSLEQGAVSEPVRTSFGVHLVKVTEVMPADRPSFESLRAELRETIATERARKRIFGQAERLGNLAYENPDSLQPAAEALGLEIRRTDWISRQGGDSGLTAEDAVLEAAFSPELLEQGRNSDVLALDEDRRVVVRVAEQRPSRVPPLQQIRDQVVERLRSERVAELTGERAEALMERVRSGETRFSALADTAGVTLNEYGWIGRRASEEAPRGIMQTAFGMAAPADDAIKLEGVALGGGDHAVVAVRGVRDGNLEALSEQQRQSLRRALRESDASSSNQNVTAALRDAADVTIYDERL